MIFETLNFGVTWEVGTAQGEVGHRAGWNGTDGAKWNNHSKCTHSKEIDEQTNNFN